MSSPYTVQQSEQLTLSNITVRNEFSRTPFDNAYHQVADRIVDEGIWIENDRTGKRCKTIINVDMEYDVGAGEFPLLTTRKSYWKSAIAEMIGYIRGYTNAADFRALGTKTWDANANENKAWLESTYRQGPDDMGLVYGAVGNNWPTESGYDTIDLLKKVVSDLSSWRDDRGEIWTFWNPGVFHLGCLRPCMYEHHFSILGDTLYLNSKQRSNDWLLGETFNSVQCYFLLAVMAQITGLKPGKVFHKSVNVHMYEDQFDTYIEKHQDQPGTGLSGQLILDPAIDSLEFLRDEPNIMDYIHVEGYVPGEVIKYPMSV